MYYIRCEIERVKEWLESVNIEVRSSFGFSPEMQPLVFKNNPHHAAVYFYDPDGKQFIRSNNTTRYGTS